MAISFGYTPLIIGNFTIINIINCLYQGHSEGGGGVGQAHVHSAI